MARIFVYGTLRKGMYNYDTYLKDEETFCSYGYIKGSLFKLMTKTYPAYLQEGQTMVLGEIHEVSEETLQLVDEMEGYLGDGNIQNDYNKVICDVYNVDNQVIDHLPVYVYNMDNHDNAVLLGDEIKGGDYVSYVTELNQKESYFDSDVD